jgi:hypothetical protein
LDPASDEPEGRRQDEIGPGDPGFRLHTLEATRRRVETEGLSGNPADPLPHFYVQNADYPFLSDSEWLSQLRVYGQFAEKIPQLTPTTWIEWLLNIRDTAENFGLQEPIFLFSAAIYGIKNIGLQRRILSFTPGHKRPNYTELCSATRNACMTDKDRRKAMTEMGSLSQRPGETLMSYLSHFESLMLRLGTQGLDEKFRINGNGSFSEV